MLHPELCHPPARGSTAPPSQAGKKLVLPLSQDTSRMATVSLSEDLHTVHTSSSSHHVPPGLGAAAANGSDKEARVLPEEHGSR